MAVVTITFLGGPECGNVGETTFENRQTQNKLVLPLNKPVRVDPDREANPKKKEFLEHVISKATINRFFKVEEVKIAPVPKPVAPAPSPAPAVEAK